MYNYNMLSDKIKSYMGKDEFVYSIEKKRWYSYAQIWSNAYNYYLFIKKQDVREVAVILENGVELLTLYFACVLGNFMIVPIDPQKSQEEIDSILENHPGIWRIQSVDELPVCSEEEIMPSVLSVLLDAIDFEKIYLVTYTSGSTGQAKGVRHSLKNLLLASISFGDKVGFGKESVVCHTMPMTYMAGILNTIFMPFIQGSKIVLYPRFNVMTAVSFWKNTQAYGVNTFWLSPTMLNILMTVDRKGKGADYLKTIDPVFCIGTAPLFPQLKNAFEERYGVQLLQSYGLSETLFVSTKVREGTGDIQSVGEVLDEVNLRFSQSEEILIDVPWMFHGYSNENTSDYFEGAYYLSGDLGTISEGELFITGRKKDLIVRGGMNISPKQMEEKLLDSGFVTECAISSVIDKCEEVVICWYKAENEVTNPGVLLNGYLAQHLGKAYKVDKYICIKEIPKNLNGKVDKERLKREYSYDS